MFRRIGLRAVGMLLAMSMVQLAVPAEAQDFLYRPPTTRSGGTAGYAFASTNDTDPILMPGNYRTGIVRPAGTGYSLSAADPSYAATCDNGCASPYALTNPGSYRVLDNVQLFATVDGFQGPLDLDGLNGNYGVRLAINGGFPVLRSLGIGGQIGTAETLADFHGTQFTGSEIRAQNFTTVGLFQRNPDWAPRLSYGFAYDWLSDDYYSNLHFSQWRLKLAWHMDQNQDLGLWACIPTRGDSVALPNPPPQQGTSLNLFDPIAQGVFYYQRYWTGGKSTSCWIGLAEEPGEVVFGADARMPLSTRLAVVGGFHYVLPSASGSSGQDEEIWNLSFGIELVPGRIHARPGKYFPFLPLADNGDFAVRRF